MSGRSQPNKYKQKLKEVPVKNKKMNFPLYGVSMLSLACHAHDETGIIYILFNLMLGYALP